MFSRKSRISYFISTILLLLNVSAKAQQKLWTLSVCIDRALAENISLKEAKVNNTLYHINYIQSKANALPNLNLAASQSFLSQQTYNDATNAYSQNALNTNAFGLNSTITIFNAFKIKNTLKQNKLNVDAGELDVQKQANDLILNVIAAYMLVLSDYEALDIAKAQVLISTDHLSYTEKYVKAGSLPESNLLQMQAQLAADNSAVTEAGNQLSLAKLNLMQLLELPFDKNFELQRPDTVWHDPIQFYEPESIYAKAVQQMPEVKSANIKTNAANFGLKVARSELWPKLTLNAGLNTNYNSAASLLTYQTTTSLEQIGYLQSNPSQVVLGNVTKTTTGNNYYPFNKQLSDNLVKGLTLNLNVPIFNNALYKADIQRAQENKDYAELNESLVKNQLRKNIETAYADLLAASKTFASARLQLLYQERSYHDIEVKFKFGAINTTDLFVEKNNLAKAKLNFSQAKFQYLFKAKILAFYVGEKITD